MTKSYNFLKLLFVLLIGCGMNASAQTTFNYTGGLQSYTVPVGVTSIAITTKGAQGGGNGGKGAIISGVFNVTPGQVLQVLVGQAGQTGNDYTVYGHGGGGGSFVATTGNIPMIVAGGGGGASIYNYTGGQDAQTSQNGGSIGEYGEAGGTNGNGGSEGLGGAGCGGVGHSGGGFYGDGLGQIPSQGKAFVNGGAGGTSNNVDNCINSYFGGGLAVGGYGGGGAGGNGGGGGGGYSGGAGGSNESYPVLYPGGGGGGSYNAGSPQVNNVGNTGNGLVTICPLPPAVGGIITGNMNVCVGATTTLSDPTDPAGGGWGTSNSSIATVDASTGVVTGVSAGTVTISYAVLTTCPYTVATTTVTVNPLPAPVSGNNAVCVGSTTNYTDITAFGAWSSSNTTMASIGSGSGIVTGMSAGTPTITYTLLTGCYSTKNITVNALPASISGLSSVCAGSSITLSDADMGGIWSNNDPSVANINSSTGELTGVSAGTTIVTYTATTGCITTTVINVNPLPSAISGTMTVCENATTTLSDAGGGTWSSNDLMIATVGMTDGMVTGVAAGTTTVTYTLPVTGCMISTVVTVNPVPSAVLGTMQVCEAGGTVTLSDATSGGTWISNNTSAATVDVNTGVVTGVSAGTSSIIYTLTATGCMTYSVMVVNPLPAAITGTANVCEGLSTTLSDSDPGGTWTSDNTPVATTSGNIINGITSGNANITYTLSTGCMTSTSFTVNPLPAAITGNMNVCLGSANTLSSASAGGSWTSLETNVATANPTSGMITGVVTGMATIVYTLPTGCMISANVTVNAVPVASISGTNTCIGSLLTVSGTPFSNVVWQNNSSTLKTSAFIPAMDVNGTSIGLSDGITPFGMYVTPSGDLYVSDFYGNRVLKYPAGYTSSTPGIVVAEDGLLYPVGVYVNGAGDVYVANYLNNNVLMFPSGSTSTTVGTIVADNGIAGPAAIHMNANGELFVANNGIGTITKYPAGSVSGTPGTTVASGYANIIGMYVDPSDTIYVADYANSAITKHAPGSISGTVVAGGNGAGSAANQLNLPSGVFVDNTGNIFVSDRSNNRVQMFPAGSTSATNGVTVAGTGSSGSGANEFDTPENTFVDQYGNLYVSDFYNNRVQIFHAGTTTDTITAPAGGNYTAVVTGLNGCTATTAPFNIHIVGNIGGNMSVCAGLTTVLTDTSAGGTWSSNDLSVATIGATTGIASGVVAGTSTITYTTPAGCTMTGELTVNPLPSSITGTATVCQGVTTSLSNVDPGSWYSGNSSIATVGITSGVVTGVSAGTATVTFQLPTTCITTAEVTVLPAPATHNVVGGGHYCSGGMGSDIGLDNSDAGFSYQLFHGSTPVGSSMAGSGSALDFGYQTLSGSYSIVATDNTTSCEQTMAVGAAVIIDPLPNTHGVTGGGSFCADASGVPVGVNNSDGGIDYLLYRGSALVGTPVSGSGSPISFGLQTIAGTYKVTAMDAITGCTQQMTDSAVVIVNPMVHAGISISGNLTDSICLGEMDTFSTSIVNGGSTPHYQWSVNGVNMGTNSPLFSYIPANGDVVVVTLTSNANCIIYPGVASDEITINVDAVHIPAVSIVASAGSYIAKGQRDTLTASAIDAGPNPRYQWFRNGNIIPGATANTYVVVNPIDKDSVGCVVRPGGHCGLPSFNALVLHVSTTDVNPMAFNSDIHVLPNPSKGLFTVKGALGIADDEEVTLQVTNMLGQVVYENKVMSHYGEIDQQIQLNNTIANGMYLLNVRTNEGQKVFHIVIEQ